MRRTSAELGVEQELLQIVETILKSIHTGDSATYARLCDPGLVCFEGEVTPYRIDGLPFHVDMINHLKESGYYASLIRCDMLTPTVQVFGEAAIVGYTRLMTYGAAAGLRTAVTNETRVFVKREGDWKMVHFHRSAGAA